MLLPASKTLTVSQATTRGFSPPFWGLVGGGGGVMLLVVVVVVFAFLFIGSNTAVQ